jgi:hypothetical protein
MIHAKELRYGNKVQTPQGDVITVQQILCNTLIYDTQIKVSREVASIRGGSRSSHMTQVVEVYKEADLQEISPIALTPKVLERHGFRNYVREQWILKIGSSNIDFEFDSEGLRLRESIPSRISIRYLHQLQNFLYAIVGHELEEAE